MILLTTSTVIGFGENLYFNTPDDRYNYGVTGFELGNGDVVNGPSFDNYGTISVYASVPGFVTSASGVWTGNAIFWPASVTIANHGMIRVEAVNGVAQGLSVGYSKPTIDNAGDILAIASTAARGLFASGNTITNFGTIVAQGGVSATAMYTGGGPIHNGGRIEAESTGSGDAIAIDYHQYKGSTNLIENSGAMLAHNSGGGVSVAILRDGAGDDFTLINSGTITADYVIRDLPGTWFMDGFRTIQHIHNTGVMTGRIELGTDADTLENAGAINGDVDLGDQSDLYDGRSGTINGMVSGGGGADTLMGGAGHDYLQGNAGADTESGGSGDDWVIGGQDNDQLSGDGGFDIVYGNLGNDTAAGGEGGDWVRGGQGDDSLSGGAGDDWLSGDKGADTISGGAGADTFNTFVGAGVDRIIDFSLAEGDRIHIEGAATYVVRQQDGDTIVDLGGGDQIVLAGVSVSAPAATWTIVG